MFEFLEGWSPVEQALAAGLFTWGMTAAGAGLVFFFKEVNRKILDGMLGFAAGVMIAASFWSLLAPAIEHSEQSNPFLGGIVPVLFGFLLGGTCMRLIDIFLPHLHPGAPPEETEGIKTTWHRSMLLISAKPFTTYPKV